MLSSGRRSAPKQKKSTVHVQHTPQKRQVISSPSLNASKISKKSHNSPTLSSNCSINDNISSLETLSNHTPRLNTVKSPSDILPSKITSHVDDAKTSSNIRHNDEAILNSFDMQSLSSLVDTLSIPRSYPRIVRGAYPHMSKLSYSAPTMHLLRAFSSLTSPPPSSSKPDDSVSASPVSSPASSSLSLGNEDGNQGVPDLTTKTDITSSKTSVSTTQPPQRPPPDLMETLRRLKAATEEMERLKKDYNLDITIQSTEAIDSLVSSVDNTLNKKDTTTTTTTNTATTTNSTTATACTTNSTIATAGTTSATTDHVTTTDISSSDTSTTKGRITPRPNKGQAPQNKNQKQQQQQQSKALPPSTSSSSSSSVAPSQEPLPVESNTNTAPTTTQQSDSTTSTNIINIATKQNKNSNNNTNNNNSFNNTYTKFVRRTLTAFKIRPKKKKTLESSGGGDLEAGSFGKSMAGAIFFSFISLLTAWLCSWQIQRMAWKEDLINERVSQCSEPPAPLFSIYENLLTTIGQGAGDILNNDDDDNDLTTKRLLARNIDQNLMLADIEQQQKSNTDLNVLIQTLSNIAKTQNDKENELISLFSDPRKYFSLPHDNIDNIHDNIDTLYNHITLKASEIHTLLNVLELFKSTTEFHPVTIDGQIDYSREVFLGPISAPLDGGNFKNVDADKGYYIITPMRLAMPIRVDIPVGDDERDDLLRKYNIDTGILTPGLNARMYVHEVLLNRGWIPLSLINTYINNTLMEHDGKTPESIMRQQQNVLNYGPNRLDYSYDQLSNAVSSTIHTNPNIHSNNNDNNNTNNNNNNSNGWDILSSLGIGSKAAEITDTYNNDSNNNTSKDTLSSLQHQNIESNTWKRTLSRFGLTPRQVDAAGIKPKDLFTISEDSGKIYPLLTDRPNGINTPYRRVSGILHYGASLDLIQNRNELASIKTNIQNTDKDSYKFLSTPILSTDMRIAPITLHLPDGKVISSLLRNKTPIDNAINVGLPIPVIDVTDPMLSKKVPPAKSDLTYYDNIKLNIKRRGPDDHIKFKTMPETHAGYAMTWGSFSAVGGYLAYRQFTKPIIQQRLTKVVNNVLKPSNTGVSQVFKDTTSQKNKILQQTPSSLLLSKTRLNNNKNTISINDIINKNHNNNNIPPLP